MTPRSTDGPTRTPGPGPGPGCGRRRARPILPSRRYGCAVAGAISEDVGPLGDLTALLVPEDDVGRVRVVARAEGVLAGRLCAEEAFSQIDDTLVVDWRILDGEWLVPGSVVAEVSGPMRSILTAERTALNFLCHLSGIATLTRRFVDAVTAANPATRVLDTRKTTPGLRVLEKAAVRGRWGLEPPGRVVRRRAREGQPSGPARDHRGGGRGETVVAGPDGGGGVRPPRAGVRSRRGGGLGGAPRQHDAVVGVGVRGARAGAACPGDGARGGVGRA